MKRIPGILLIFLFALAGSAQYMAPQASEIPAYHDGPPPKTEKLPPIVKPADLPAENKKYPFQAHAYEIAAKTPAAALYQQPCYCRCDRSVGHTSLHSCFESAHGSHCSVCMQEAYFTYEETKKGKTPAQIREEIMRGDWAKIDLQQAMAIK